MTIEVSLWGFVLVIYLTVIDFCYSLVQKEPPQVHYTNEAASNTLLDASFGSSLSVAFFVACPVFSSVASSLPFVDYIVAAVVNKWYSIVATYDNVVTDISRVGYLLKIELGDIVSEVKAACDASRLPRCYNGNIFADDQDSSFSLSASPLLLTCVVVGAMKPEVEPSFPLSGDDTIPAPTDFSSTVEVDVPSCSPLLSPPASKKSLFVIDRAMKVEIEPSLSPSGDVAIPVSVDYSSVVEVEVPSCSPLLPPASDNNSIIIVTDIMKAGTEPPSFLPASSLLLSSIPLCATPLARKIPRSFVATATYTATSIVRKRYAEDDLCSTFSVRRCFGLSKDKPVTILPNIANVAQDSFAFDDTISFMDITEESNSPVDDPIDEFLDLDDDFAYVLGYDSCDESEESDDEYRVDDESFALILSELF